MDFSNLLSMAPEIWQASLETALMLGIGLTVAIVLGGPLGIVLFLTQPGQLWAHRALNGVLGWLVNLVRSFPFIILMVSLVPLTRLLVGSTIGPVAAAVPLSFAAIPYFARLVEQTLREVPRGVLEAAEAMGASPWQIIRSRRRAVTCGFFCRSEPAAKLRGLAKICSPAFSCFSLKARKSRLSM